MENAQTLGLYTPRRANGARGGRHSRYDRGTIAQQNDDQYNNYNIAANATMAPFGHVPRYRWVSTLALSTSFLLVSYDVAPNMRTVFSGIPEASPPPPDSTSGRRTVTAGPNAFALRAAKVDAHRLQSNAFYQQATAAEAARLQTFQDQEMASRLELAPPTAAHPAFRENFRLGDSSSRTNLVKGVLL
jgi:hypothetical protein